jgi:hypothetical protein
LKLTQGAAERFNFAFIGQLLAFRQFDQFQHFIHLVEGLTQSFHHFGDFLNGLADGGSRCGPERLGWRHQGRRTGRDENGPGPGFTPHDRRGLRHWFGHRFDRRCGGLNLVGGLGGFKTLRGG